MIYVSWIVFAQKQEFEKQELVMGWTISQGGKRCKFHQL